MRSRLEIFHGQTWHKITMARVEFAGHTNFLSQEVSTFLERVCLRPNREQERMLNPRNIQLQEFFPLQQNAVSRDGHFRRGKACFFDGFGNQNRVEGFPGFWKNLRLTLYQIHFRAINAIQALQGFLSPIRSKTSYHSVDLDSCFLNLRRCWQRRKEAC